MKAAQNPFDCLGLDPVFDLASSLLNEAYHRVLRAIHPDRFVGCTGAEKLAASLQAAMANEAYQTLQSLYHRARALLDVKGHPFDDRQMPPASFLMQVMTYQEALEKSEAEAEKGKLVEELKNFLRSVEQTLSEAFRDDDFPQATMALCQYKYLERLVEQAEASYRVVQRDLAKEYPQSQPQGGL